MDDRSGSTPTDVTAAIKHGYVHRPKNAKLKKV
jgi:hypothetical protein